MIALCQGVSHAGLTEPILSKTLFQQKYMAHRLKLPCPAIANRRRTTQVGALVGLTRRGAAGLDDKDDAFQVLASQNPRLAPLNGETGCGLTARTQSSSRRPFDALPSFHDEAGRALDRPMVDSTKLGQYSLRRAQYFTHR